MGGGVLLGEKEGWAMVPPGFLGPLLPLLVVPQDAWEQDAGDERTCFRQSPQGYDVPPPRVDRPEPESLTVPVNGSLYTEEAPL